MNRFTGICSSGARSQLMGARAPDHVAAETFDRALDAFLRTSGDPLTCIQPTLLEHPHFVMGHVLVASVGVAAKHPRMLPTLRAALECAQAPGIEATEQERAHVVAAQAWRDGQPELAAERYTAILREWPHDLLALRLAQSCHFFVGRTPMLREVIETVWPSWTESMPGYEYLLAMAAFGYAENGDDGEAEALGNRALAIQPAFPFAIHAVAHALVGRGSYRQGALFMQQHRRHWDRNSQMVSHNAWHAAMFELESGQSARALEILDESIMPRITRAASDAADATALLWRLELDGIDPGARWSLLSDCWVAHASPGYWPYLDVHAAIAFSAARHTLRARMLEQAISVRAREIEPGREARAAALFALRAVEAFSAGAHLEARVTLCGLRSALRQIGGSDAQHELFSRMFAEAGRRLRAQTTTSAEWRVAA